MRCEVCGVHLREKPIRAIIEGAKLEVCSQCAKLSAATWEKEQRSFSSIPKQANIIDRARPTRPQKPRLTRQAEEEFVLVKNYGEIVRRAREKQGWSQEELGRAINEKESLVAKIETQKLVPPLAITLKIEHVLGVHLTEKEQSVTDAKMPDVRSMELTLGDIVVVKKRETS